VKLSGVPSKSMVTLFGQQFGGNRRRHRQLHIRLIGVDVIQAGSQGQLGRGGTDHFCAANCTAFPLMALKTCQHLPACPR